MSRIGRLDFVEGQVQGRVLVQSCGTVRSYGVLVVPYCSNSNHDKQKPYSYSSHSIITSIKRDKEVCCWRCSVAWPHSPSLRTVSVLWLGQSNFFSALSGRQSFLCLTRRCVVLFLRLCSLFLPQNDTMARTKQTGKCLAATLML